MRVMRSVGLILGIVFVATYAYSFYIQYWGLITCLVGMSIGCLSIFYGVNGRDLVQELYKKLTGHSFNIGSSE